VERRDRELGTGGAAGVGRGGPGSDCTGRAGPASSRSAVAPSARPREKAREWERVRDEGELSASLHGSTTRGARCRAVDVAEGHAAAVSTPGRPRHLPAWSNNWNKMTILPQNYS
jgi:hypothetical protein